MKLEDCNLGDTDKGSSVHNYLPLYERHLEPDYIETLTEIGVYTGGSLRMWARWLPDAQIIGVDNEPENYVVPSEPENSPQNIVFLAGDATLMDPWPSDVVIDDGSHHGDDQLAVFDGFWPLLRPGGWYVIEDLETVWSDSFRAGQEMRSFMAHRLEAALRHAGSGSEVAELHAYEQILFIKKR